MEQEATFVGIDVAKARVDVAVRPSGDISFAPAYACLPMIVAFAALRLLDHVLNVCG